jgi:transcriptional regulator with XRE-family HTH domain
MQKTLEHAKINRVSPATIRLLIHERNKGKSLRQLGQMFGVSHEQVRQILAKHNPALVTFSSESKVAIKLGYPVPWLIKLRKEGIINPIKPGGRWLYSEEQVRQIISLIAEMRRCERCGEPRPKGYQRFCRECSQYRKKNNYSDLPPENDTSYNLTKGGNKWPKRDIHRNRLSTGSARRKSS